MNRMAAVLGLMCVCSFAVAQQEMPMSAEKQAEMEAWMKAGTPGPHHDVLKGLEGEWDAAGTFWMEPGAPAMDTVAKYKVKSDMGGRYLVAEYHGDFMGQPFIGKGLSGYDNIKGKYFDIWYDNFSTGVMVSWGTYDEKTKSITYSGEITKPDGKKMDMRSETKFISPDQHRLTMWEREAGAKDWHKHMQINFTRKGTKTGRPE